MPQVVIENPILNSPFAEPARHFKFDDDGITNEIIEGKRRISAYFVPVPQARKRGKQLAFSEWTKDRIQPNDTINQVRERVKLWRAGGCKGITTVTRRLLEYWKNPERENKLFFCQIEALETAIYITEAARQFGFAFDAEIDESAWSQLYATKSRPFDPPQTCQITVKVIKSSGDDVVKVYEV